MDLVWGTIAAIGAAQGLLLAVLLSGRRGEAAWWLAALLFAVSLVLAEEAADISGLGRSLAWLMGSTAMFELLLGPLLLGFSLALYRQGVHRRASTWLHFVPFAVATVAVASLPRQSPLVDGLLLVKGPVLFGYLFASWRVLASGPPIRTIRNARVGVGALTTLGLVTFLVYHLARLGVPMPVDSDRLAGLGLTVGLYVVALVTFWPRERADSDAARIRYSTSPLDANRKRRLAARLIHHLDEERPWLDGELDLAGLAETSGIPAHHLSQIISEELNTTFYELLSHRRAHEVKRLLMDPACDRYGILDLAFEAGFNSKASFHRAFARFCGTTPGIVRKSRGASPSPSSE